MGRQSEPRRPLLVGLILLAMVSAACSPPAKADAATAASRLDRPAWSPDGRYLAFTEEGDVGLYLFCGATGECIRISDAPGSGYACNFSSDGAKLGFKRLIPRPGPGTPLQQPMIYSLADRALVPLCDPAVRAGTPSFSNDGTTAYTVDRELRVVSPSGSLATYALDHYVNLAPLSPDGKRVAFTDNSDVLCVLELATAKQRTLTPPGIACFGPVWSPDSRRLAAGTISGGLICADLDTEQTWDLGEGTGPSWTPDARTLVFTRTTRHEGVALVESDVWTTGFDGSSPARLTQGETGREASARLSPDGSKLAYVDLRDGRLYGAALAVKQTAAKQTFAENGQDRPLDTTEVSAFELGTPEPLLGDAPTIQLLAAGVTDPNLTVTTETGLAATVPGQVRLSRTCPYVHQVYDTPNAFNGHWACGATSAIMAIQYYEILPAWNVTCSSPYSHVSPFGQYVSEIYSFNGYTYNIGSEDPNGRLGYGGYGYIVRNNWADTKGYMRDYFIRHGLGSSVDWSPTWSELQAEINADHPLVLLNTLTTSGHYITAIGYFENERTLVFNDPYGNKNTPGYPSYDGAGAYYDWPGYSNGYKNLNTVPCYIYARGGSAPIIASQPTDRMGGRGGTAVFSVTAKGLGPFTYRWQKNRADIVDGTRVAGAKTAALTVSGVVPQDAGLYRCVVGNTYGAVTSDEARLRISSPDSDGDGDIDVEDFGRMQICLTSPGLPLESDDCSVLDLDGDGDVDRLDLAILQSCLAGPDLEPPAGCL